MGMSTDEARAITANRATRYTHVGLLTGTEASPGAELSSGAYSRRPITWPTDDTDGTWVAPAVDVPTATTDEPTLVAVFSAASGGAARQWRAITGVAPKGVTSVRVTPTIDSAES